VGILGAGINVVGYVSRRKYNGLGAAEMPPPNKKTTFA